MADPSPASLLDAMPRDVADTYRRLLVDGFGVEAIEPALSASGMVTLRAEDLRARFIRDKTQWDFQLELGSGWTYLAALHHARTGALPPFSTEERLPSTLPPGLEWTEAVPAAIAWVRSSDDAEAVIENTEHIRRADYASRRAAARKARRP